MMFIDDFTNWIVEKVRPDRPSADEPTAPTYVFAGQPVRVISSGAVMTAEVGQRKSPQLYRITNFVSSAVQSVPWFAEADPDSDEQVPEAQVKAINDLLKSPNDTMTPQQLRYWVALNLMLYARAHFKVGVSSSGLPNGIYPLATKYVSGVLNNRGTVETYEYGAGEERKTVLPSRRTAEKRGGNLAYAAEISFPSLSGLVEYNKAPAAIESIAYPLAIIQALTQRALDTASGHPNVKYVITAEKTLTKPQQAALHKYLDSSQPGDEESGGVLFLYNTDVKIHKLDNELSDIHSKLPLDDMTRQIAGVFGVPIALIGLGSADAAKYANNYGESRLSFWQDTIVPSYLSPIAAGMTQALCPPGARIVFDLDEIPALWPSRSALGESLSKVGFLTTNEKREVLGYESDDSLPVLVPQSATPAADQPPPAAIDNVTPLRGRQS